MEKIIKDLFNEAKNMSKREKKQSNAMLIISQLYYKHFKYDNKIMNCLNSAKKIAYFSLTNPHKLILYILLSNKYIYYIDVDDENQVEYLVEEIKNHIITIKTDKNIDACRIEKYFKNIVNLIEIRKKDKEYKKIYDEINISSS